MGEFLGGTEEGHTTAEELRQASETTRHGAGAVAAAHTTEVSGANDEESTDEAEHPDSS